MTPFDIEPDTFVADYTGEPGGRTFFVQAAEPERTTTYLLEKQQLAVLADKLREVLVMVDRDDPIALSPPARDPLFHLRTPIEPEWRIGTIGLSYDDVTEQVIVALHPVTEAEPGADDADDVQLEPDDFAVRIRLSPAQVRAFVVHALAVVGEGRPTCQLCGLPMDPGGHACPASNGHRTEV